MMLASVLPFLTWLVAISSSLGPFVQAAEDELSIEVTDVFIVKTGAGGGSCDGHMDKVKDWFKDSLAIASAPITVANNALTVDSSPANLLGMEYLGTYFSIPPPDDEEDSHSRRVLNNVERAKEFMKGTYLLTTGMPWLYCGDGWAVELEWTDEVKGDRVTREDQGEMTGQGTRLSGVFLGYYIYFYMDRLDENGNVKDAKSPPYKPWWVEDLKQYFFAPSSTGGNPCVTGHNIGSTMLQTAPYSVTLCVGNDGMGLPELLSNMDPVTGTMQLVRDHRSVSITLYHEIFHLLIGAPSKDYAYEFVEITGWSPSYLTGETITWDQTIVNPESYTQFALAAYLGERYPNYVFWNGWSKELELN